MRGHKILPSSEIAFSTYKLQQGSLLLFLRESDNALTLFLVVYSRFFCTLAVALYFVSVTNASGEPG